MNVGVGAGASSISAVLCAGTSSVKGDMHPCGRAGVRACAWRSASHLMLV